MSRAGYVFDWSDLAFGSKKPLSSLKAAFIAAPRELLASRFIQLVKQYLPQGNIILGVAKEDYIDGFEGQPQFRTLQLPTVQTVIDKVNAAATPHKVYSLQYFQRETDYIIEKLKVSRVILVNGSWRTAFHNRSTYYLLANNRIAYDMVSPFASDDEARSYETGKQPDILQSAQLPPAGAATEFDAASMLQIADQAARLSYDYSYQTGASLGKPAGKGYRLLAYAFNKVVPFQTYALHHGAAREIHFSPPNDLNYYDTVHAETELLVRAQRERLDFHGTSLFINLLPCPTCARMLCETDIQEIVYRDDHSNGYAVQLLELAGKTVRRLV